MAKKKKDKDFQKVKIKVGRKLKRQNETIVDLKSKKIKLPKERDVEKSTLNQKPKDIIDEAIVSLDLEKSSTQLQAVQSLNRILDPFVRQLASLTASEGSCYWTVGSKQLSQSAAIFRALFHCSSDTELSVQLGTLLSSLHRLCRAAQDPRLGSSLIRLCTNLVQLVSIHPKFVSVLSALDGCAIALLQRPESQWLWVGCQLSGLVLQTHCQLVSAFSVRSGPGNILDASEQLVRSSIYSRALIRLNDDLQERQSIANMSTQRSNFLRTALAFFKDHQYSLRSTLGNREHPFLLAGPKILSDAMWKGEWSMDLHFPLEGYNLHTILQTPLSLFASLDPSLFEMESSTLLRSNPSIAIQKNHKRLSFGRSESKNPPLWLNQVLQEQRLLVSLLEHGIDLLGELSASIKEPLLEDLYCVLRTLRVFLESKSIAYLKHGAVNQGGRKNVNVYSTLCRFCQRLYAQFPIRISALDSEFDGTTQRLHQSAGGHSISSENPSKPELTLPSAPPPGSTRQEVRRWQKRIQKLRNRQKRQHTDATEIAGQEPTSVPNDTVSGESDSAAISVPKVSSTVTNESDPSSINRPARYTQPNHSPTLHRVNQALLHLLTLFELCDISSSAIKPDPNLPACWPPPPEFLERFAHYLLDDLFPVEAHKPVWPLPIVLNWFRSFDFYLLTHLRNPKRFKSLALSQRLLVAPILMVLSRMISGYLRTQEESKTDETSVSLTRGQHRLYGRAAGLLTAIISIELCGIRQAPSEPMDIDATETNPFEVKLNYDESWIPQVMKERFNLTCAAQSIYDQLVRFLCQLVCTEPARVLFVPPLSAQLCRTLCDQLEQTHTKSLSTPVPVHLIDDTWAQCLVRLHHCRFAPVLHMCAADRKLQDRLTEAEKRVNQCGVLRDLGVQYNLLVPDEAAHQLGWIIPGYLPSLNGRYACPYFWQATRDNM